MELESFQPSFGLAVNLNVRCLVGLHGSHKDDGLDEAFSAALDEASGDADLLQYTLELDDTDRVQFLVGSQSLKSNLSQLTLVTLLESDGSQPTHVTKQTFAHPDGEVIDLTALAAQPDWVVSTYSAYCIDQPELRSGARVWRLPSTANTSSRAADGSGEFLGLTERTGDPTNTLEYVTTLPLDRYAGVRRIASHPSSTCADLACVVGPPRDTTSSKAGLSSSSNLATSYLTVLQAPSASGSGDYRESASAQLCLPQSPSAIFTSHLRTNLGHLYKTFNSAGRLAITSPPYAIRWSSYQQAGQLAVAFESGVLGWDIRSMKPSFWLEAAHWPCVRDLDFNPHRPNLLVTGGDDGYIRLWDLRFLKPKPRSDVSATKDYKTLSRAESEFSTKPLYSIQAHSHWVWCVRYHPTRDQLLLSAGSDCRVYMYSLASFSSDAIFRSTDNMNSDREQLSDHRSVGSSGNSVNGEIPRGEKTSDGPIGKLEQHEESVYAVDWSPVDPWYFASVSYDGNLLINQVPEPVKLNILLHTQEE
ncbi:hypothetical protein T265_10400 [Opisthorchis viverrini]|uniref:EIPR1-like beta-propeller domain-containing protein n=1 Tax=Opisthorchis viverrini TaxID=6198 RepID=A0A074ZDG2_OPIVI|nr:hypothetical protein T265_10400 [Opisthorchis viverrini]KER21240.1 hypothetical protein T265_10400 [Opisthorchis viverrini]